MNTSTTRHELVVIGAGIAGLVAANTALDLGVRPTVIEPHPPGGRARTAERDGWSLNVGAHALYLRGELRRQLLAWGHDLPGGTPSDIRIAGMRDGRLSPFPLSPGSIARTRLLGVRGKARFATLFARLGKLDSGALRGTSLAEWLADEPDDVRAVVESVVRTSTYTNAPALLDAAAAVEQLRLAAGGVRYLDHGWASIVTALTERLAARGVMVTAASATAVHAEGVSPQRDVVVEVALGERTERLAAPAVIIAAGGPELEGRLLGRDPLDVGPRVESCAVDLLVDHPVPARGVFGIDEPRYLNPHSAVARLTPPGHGLLSGLHYLAPGTDPGTPAAERQATRRLAELLGVRPETIVDDRVLLRSTVVHGLPLAARGGLVGRPGVQVGGSSSLEHAAAVFRAGDWVGPVGQLADAAAASGAAAATAAVARCSKIVA